MSVRIKHCLESQCPLLKAAQWVLTNADKRGETTDDAQYPRDDFLALRRAIAKALEQEKNDERL